MQEDLRYNRKTFMHKYLVALLALVTSTVLFAQAPQNPKSNITDVLV